MARPFPGPNDSETAQHEPYSLRAFLHYFLRLGALGFGGPIALAGYMQRDLVEKRGWITKKDYVDGLALAQLAPGPLAAQLAIYLGWAKGRVWGATSAAAAFILPSFVMVLALSAVYVRFDGLPWMQSVFYGVGAAVIAIISRSALKLAKLALARDWLLWTLFALSAGMTAWLETEVVWLFLASGAIVLLARTRRGPGSALPSLLPPGFCAALASAAPIGVPVAWPLLVKVTLTFAAMGAFVFGSGLAIVPFLHGSVVNQLHWLSERQFLDAVAVAMITPGPVVITVAFIGYLIAGLKGAIIAAIGTFVPCYLFTVIPAPYMKKYGKLPAITAFVDGVTAAAVGAIAGSVIVLAQRSIVDIATALLALATAALLWRFKKLQEPVVVAVAALLGLVLYPLLH